MVVGRGSSIEAFPLFGYNLDDYDELFAEKLELLQNSSESLLPVGQIPSTQQRLFIKTAKIDTDLGRCGWYTESFIRAVPSACH
jgi:hypothetical protein